MPFKHFLENSIDFERTHQLVLKTLLADNSFAGHLTGFPVTSTTKIYLEPYGSLFDLGLFTTEEKCLCLIELKMWSNLSKNQLERQTAFLKNHGCKGLHILLGTTDLQYWRDATYDEIADLTGQVSHKIGYHELIEILDKFIADSKDMRPTVQMAKDYKEALQRQAQYLDTAWQNKKAHEHHRFYSTYSKIQRFLTEDNFSMYTVNNPGGAVYILNDGGSWFGFKYKGHSFELYQELLNNQYMLRIYSDGVPNHTRKEVKEEFLKQFRITEFYNLGWDHDFKTSKYHKVAVFNPEFKDTADCKRVAGLLKSMNPVIKAIAVSLGKVND